MELNAENEDYLASVVIPATDPLQFRLTVLEGEDYTVDLEPVRRDLQALFAQVTLTVDKKSLLIKSALLRGTDGGWTLIQFGDRKLNGALPEGIFDSE